MSQFERLDIKYRPLDIENSFLTNTNYKNSTSSQEDLDNEAIADKLLDHLDQIKAYRDRVSAIDYLIDGAAKLAANPTYTTNDRSIINDITLLGGESNTVDFELFKRAIALMIKGYQDLALIGLTGVAND
jgi:hypothetical protein